MGNRGGRAYNQFLCTHKMVAYRLGHYRTASGSQRLENLDVDVANRSMVNRRACLVYNQVSKNLKNSIISIIHKLIL